MVRHRYGPLLSRSTNSMAADWQSPRHLHRQHSGVLASLQRDHHKSQKKTVTHQQDFRQEVGWQHGRHASSMPFASHAHLDIWVQRLGAPNISWRQRQITADSQPYGTHHHRHPASNQHSQPSPRG